MTDETLLGCPSWRTLTDPQLKRAILLAKRRGRQTAELIFAQAQENDQPERLKKIANFELYLNHCVKVAKEGEEWAKLWGHQTAIEACADPRFAWFCVVYQRVLWRLQGQHVPAKVDLTSLQQTKRRSLDLLYLAQHKYSMKVASIHRHGGIVGDPVYQSELLRLYRSVVSHLDCAMLAVVTLNVATEEWIARSRG